MPKACFARAVNIGVYLFKYLSMIYFYFLFVNFYDIIDSSIKKERYQWI